MNERPSTFVQRGGIWVIAQFALMASVIVLGVAFPAQWMRTPGLVAGAVLVIAAAWFGIPGTLLLGRNRTVYPRPRKSSSLVTSGMYARVRHPLYTSVMLMSFGWALLWQSNPSLLVCLIQVPFFLAKAKREERWLREKFPGYSEYANRVPGFIPRLGRSPKVQS